MLYLVPVLLLYALSAMLFRLILGFYLDHFARLALLGGVGHWKLLRDLWFHGVSTSHTAAENYARVVEAGTRQGWEETVQCPGKYLRFRTPQGLLSQSTIVSVRLRGSDVWVCSIGNAGLNGLFVRNSGNIRLIRAAVS